MYELLEILELCTGVVDECVDVHGGPGQVRHGVAQEVLDVALGCKESQICDSGY